MQQVGIAELLGTAQELVAGGRPQAAAALYRDWVAQRPDDPHGHVALFNLGVLLSDQNELPAAAQALSDAIRRNPAFLPAFVNLGSVYDRLGATDVALAHWGHVTAALAGVTGEAIQYKSAALRQIGRLEEAQRKLGAAEATLRQVIELGQQPRDIIQHWVSLRQRQCRWPAIEPVAGLDRAELLKTMAPLSLACHSDDPLLQLAGAARTAHAEVGRPRDRRTTADFAARPRPADGRLRIGYLSSDLRAHAIGSLMADLFRHHDRSGFEVFLYYTGIDQDDPIKLRIRDQAEHWCSIRHMDDDAALARMLADGIDILVDVNGHTRDGRAALLARRPAPVIVNWLGFPGSMGTPWHHYIIADATIIPPTHEHYYSEAVRRLPCYQPNDPTRRAAEPPSRAACGLPEDGTVFCCFNGAQKITRFLFERWMAILRGVPGSVLWLLGSGPEAEARLRAAAAAAGVAPDRLVFAPFTDNAAHLARYALADLFLDTTPYGAHTTASDALWLGVPVLTQPGRCFASRVCASLVSAAGIPELVVETAEAYVAAAIDLGRDRARLQALRARLAAERATAPLFDTPRLVRALEGLFRGMWQEFEAGRLPVPDLANLEAYLEVAAGLDSDAVETTALGDYEARVTAGLAALHDWSPLPPDGRLWRKAAAG